MKQLNKETVDHFESPQWFSDCHYVTFGGAICQPLDAVRTHEQVVANLLLCLPILCSRRPTAKQFGLGYTESAGGALLPRCGAVHRKAGLNGWHARINTCDGCVAFVHQVGGQPLRLPTFLPILAALASAGLGRPSLYYPW